MLPGAQWTTEWVRFAVSPPSSSPPLSTSGEPPFCFAVASAAESNFPHEELPLDYLNTHLRFMKLELREVRSEHDGLQWLVLVNVQADRQVGMGASLTDVQRYFFKMLVRPRPALPARIALSTPYNSLLLGPVPSHQAGHGTRACVCVCVCVACRH